MSTGSLIEETQTAIVWRGPRKTGLIKRFLKDAFWGRLEYLIFDTPPGTSDEHLTVIKLLLNAKPEGAIIVTTPQEVALSTIRKEINFCQKMGIKILGIVENMSHYVCPCCHEISPLFANEEVGGIGGGGTRKLLEEYDVQLLGKIPFDSDFVRCCEEGKNIIREYPNSPAGMGLLNIARTIHTHTQ